MIRKIAIILSSLIFIIGAAYTFFYVDLNSDPDKSIRNLLSEKFARDCLQDVKRNEFLDLKSNNKKSLKIPETITLKDFFRN